MDMFRIVMTEEKREVYIDGRRIFLATIGDTGGWGECSAEVAETEMQKLLEEWTAAEPNQGDPGASLPSWASMARGAGGGLTKR